MTKIIIHNGDNRLVLKKFPDASFDSGVCDPPYELGFMGKAWDKSGIAYEVDMWREVYRVLKPGAHLLAFGGARTYHRLACAIEDAGFEIRDRILYLTEGGQIETHYPAWVYGSGFPKSLDISKAMDKAAGAARAVVGKLVYDGGHIQNSNKDKLSPPIGTFVRSQDDRLATVPRTSLARQWEGWGTALKPAHEPIVVARKSLEGTVIKNVLKWGCGALNVVGCRIGIETRTNKSVPRANRNGFVKGFVDGTETLIHDYGRWPANVIHDGSEEVLAEFEKYGECSVGAYPAISGKTKNVYGERKQIGSGLRRPTNTGSAARFFYCAKASPEERNLGCEFRTPMQRDESRKEGNPGGDNPRNRGVKPVKNNHPTVKPLSLMCYLVRLVTPPGGVVLDPFMGSGSTLIAAAKEGFDSVGIDLEMDNCQLAERRCRGHLGMLAEIEYVARD